MTPFYYIQKKKTKKSLKGIEERVKDKNTRDSFVYMYILFWNFY